MASPVDDELRVVAEALSRPALSLLRTRDPERVLTVLLAAFGEEHVSVSVDRLHAMVDLVWSPDNEGQDVRREAREIVAPWLRGSQRWLTRYTDQADRSDNYQLTSEAQQALAFVRSLSRPQVILTDSTVQTLLDVARSAALKATTDPQEHRAMLQARAVQLRADLADVEQGLADVDASGRVPHVDDFEVMNEARRVQDLTEALLRDLRQVKEGVEGEALRIRRAFADDARPTGQIVDIYSREMRNILSASRQGRGFESAQRLLNDRGLRRQLRHDIATVQEHRVLQRQGRGERSALSRLLSQVETATGEIFDARTSINAAFSALVRTRDVAYRQLLPQALTRAEVALDRLETQRGRRGEVPTLVELARGSGRGLRLEPELSRAALDIPSPPPAGEPPAMDLSRLWEFGGPHYPALCDAVEEALAMGGVTTVDEVFARLNDADRRPVDLLGLLTLAAAQDSLDPPPQARVISTLRPDGTQRHIQVPNMLFVRSPRPDQPLPENPHQDQPIQDQENR